MSYERRNRGLRYTPFALLATAALVLRSGWNHSLQFATLFVLLALVIARWVPWVYIVGDDGLALRFPFGRRRFLPKDSVLIRVELVGAFALAGAAKYFGYPLLDHVLYVPGRDDELRRVFRERGYNVI